MATPGYVLYPLGDQLEGSEAQIVTAAALVPLELMLESPSSSEDEDA